jgi:hypothetical protein
MRRTGVANISEAHASAPIAQHVAVNVSIFALAFAVAWAALKLYDISVRAWLSGRHSVAKKA